MLTSTLKNISELGFGSSDHVADFGCGSGYFAIELSKILGPKGKVYAVDIREEPLLKLAALAQNEDRDNIALILGDIEEPNGTHIKDRLLDGVVMSHVLPQLSVRPKAIQEANRILKPGGKLCVIEWEKKFNKESTKDLLLREGFAFSREFIIGEENYGLLYNKPLQ